MPRWAVVELSPGHSPDETIEFEDAEDARHYARWLAGEAAEDLAAAAEMVNPDHYEIRRESGADPVRVVDVVEVDGEGGAVSADEEEDDDGE